MPLYQPINYLTELPSETISKGFGLGLDAARTGAQIQQFKAAQAVSERDLADKEAAAARQKQFQNFFASAETPEELAAGIQQFPEFHEIISKSLDVRSNQERQHLLNLANQLDFTKNIQDPQARDMARARIIGDPNNQGAWAKMGTNPTQVFDMTRDDVGWNNAIKMLRVGLIDPKDRQTAETAENRLAFDVNKQEQDIEEKQKDREHDFALEEYKAGQAAELRAEGLSPTGEPLKGRTVSADTGKEIGTLTASANKNLSSAVTTYKNAKKFADFNPSGGFANVVEAKIDEFFGVKGGLNTLLADFNALSAEIAKNNLVSTTQVSNSDMEFARQGFINEKSSTEDILKAYSAATRLKEELGMNNKFTSQYLSRNGGSSYGPAIKDFDIKIGGETFSVKAGETYDEALQRFTEKIQPIIAEKYPDITVKGEKGKKGGKGSGQTSSQATVPAERPTQQMGSAYGAAAQAAAGLPAEQVPAPRQQEQPASGVVMKPEWNKYF